MRGTLTLLARLLLSLLRVLRLLLLALRRAVTRWSSFRRLTLVLLLRTRTVTNRIRYTRHVRVRNVTEPSWLKRRSIIHYTTYTGS